LTAALGAKDSCLVQGLARTNDDITRARRNVRATGRYGSVTIDRLRKDRLPYADRVVNLMVAEDLGGISMGEVTRVLSPGGKLYRKQGDSWKVETRSRPAAMDNWTHFLHDASNNAVSHDTIVDTPYHLRWVGTPQWARSHDHLSTISAVVSDGERLFSIVDEGPTAAVALPADWNLVARDAFSGVVLWRRRIGLWEGHLRGFRTGPAELPRRLVAADDRIYVTLGYGEPVSCLDGATGKLIRSYSGSRGTLEIIHHEGVLYVVAGEMDVAQAARRRGGSPPPRGKRLLAINAKSGQILWWKNDSDTVELMPLTLAVDQGRVFFQNPDAVVCLDATDGSQHWRTARPLSKQRWTWSTPTLVVHDGVVVSADRAADATLASIGDMNAKREQGDKIEWVDSSRGGEAPRGEMVAYSASDGYELWRAECRETYNAPPDVLVVGGLVWSGNVVSAKDPGITVARDLHTGEVKLQRPRDQKFFSFGMGHHRCYRNKATDKYLLMGRSGIELLDVSNGQTVANHFVRGACQYGIMPSNGLLYVPPHSCACFIQAKLSGFNALAPKGVNEKQSEPSADQRLERGPAYGSSDTRPSALDTRPSTDWPTFRSDAARSGFAPTPVATALQQRWVSQFDDGPLTSPVVAQGKLVVAARQTHTVRALDATSGAAIWTFTAGGRIDSPPTLYRGLVLFGSADGYVYCLRASDGALVWRFLAAPVDRRIVAYGQLESVWPVPGSVLVVEEPSGDAAACFVAGRSSYLDGGLRLYRVNPTSGKLLSVTPINNRDPETDLPGQFEARGVTMPGALPDILSCDGTSIFLRHTRFSLSGEPEEANVPHLFSPGGFVDDSWWHRNYWIYGTAMKNGWGGWPQMGYQVPAGRLLVAGHDFIFGFGRLNQWATHGAHVGLPRNVLPWPPDDRDGRTRGQTHYMLFASPHSPEVAQVAVGPDQTEASYRAGQADTRVRAKRRTQPRLKPRWARELGVTVRAMVLSQKALFVAGPPELLSLTGRSIDQQDLSAVRDAYDGKRGGLLWAVASNDGSKLAEYPLDSPPVFDGLIAANECLYLTTMDGRVRCFGAK